MPIQTDLSVSPYFDDYDPNKDYYKVLFRPGVAVQARELNQLQSMLQKQIERFGDHVFKRGTVVDGCEVAFDDAMRYVKLKDNQVDGAPVNLAQFTGYYVKDTASPTPLQASIQTYVDGFETQNPNLKTLYINYINSGNDGAERQQFVANDTLTVYRPDFPIENIQIANGSAGFSNSDSLVILSAVAVQNSTGGTTLANSFAADHYLTDGTANVQIVEIDTTSNSEAIILRFKPKAVDLKAANADTWTFSTNTTVQGIGGAGDDSSQVTLVDFVGTGAAATMRTGTINGDVDTITVTQKGTGYYVKPTVSVQSTGATTGQISAANLVAQTNLTTVTVANGTVSPVGVGYSVIVNDGVVYQKGYFSRVSSHRVIVEKYANTGFDKVVGFDTGESIVDSNIDTSLLDNATGEPNATAPGANRLKLEPGLVVKTKAQAEANTDFLPIVEFSGGNPYKFTARTVYNRVGEELAKRTFEESGNYVIDPFILNTKHADTIANEATKFDITIDPGIAYIQGKRVETVRNYTQSIDKGTDSFSATGAIVSLEYGNFIRVNEVGGVFDFKAGDIVDLYPTAGDYVSGGNATTVPSSGGLGTTLGTARIRSLVLESGVPGTSSAVYLMYLFDIRLATAKNFNLVRSIFYNGSEAYAKGIADAVLEGGNAVLKNNNLSSLLFDAGRPAVKTATSLNYVYRTVDTANTFEIATNGRITIGLTATGETFPYTAGSTLSSAQEQDVVVVPVANAIFAANATGTNVVVSSTTVTGTATTFDSDFEAGDYVQLANTTTSIVRQIATVDSNTQITLTTAGTLTGVDGKITMFFPAFAPISLRGDRSANVNSDANSMIIDLKSSVSAAVKVSAAYNAKTSGTTPVSKTVNRDKHIRLDLSNNATSNTGPWVLGVGDVFHLKSVSKGSNNTFTEAQGTDITNEYYIDHNQNENYYGMSYLYRKHDANTAVTTSDNLLVKFDHFTHSGEGLKGPGTSGTYSINDGITLASSTTTVNTLEIPEVYGAKGDYYDLRDQFDFRPLTAANATPVAAADVATAPINPEEQTDANRFSATDKKFPAPNATLEGTIEYYQGRVDRVVMNSNGDFNVIRGDVDVTEAPPAPNDAITINILNIPPYPSQPYQLSSNTVSFADTKIANENYTRRRLETYRVATPVSRQKRAVLQPRGYTMIDIGSLERRIEDLEYYTSFTLVETLTQRRTIPSSANSSIDRFKFGFIVDAFDDFSQSEITNPLYNASVVDGYLSPKMEEINLPIIPDTPGEEVTCPFVETSVVVCGPPSVPKAPNTTIDTSTGTITVTPLDGDTETTTTTETIFAIGREKNRNRSDTGNQVDEYFYTLSASSGTAQFFINSRDNNIGVVVFQSTAEGGPFTSEVVESGGDAQAITAADVTTYALSGLNDGRRIEHLGSLDTKVAEFRSGSIWHEDQLKLTWTHNPDNGRYYKIVVYKGKNHGTSGLGGTYGFKFFYPADVLSSTSERISGYNSVGLTPIGRYTGAVNLDVVGSIGGFGPRFVAQQTSAYDNGPNTPNILPDTNAVNNEQAFLVEITGLRANTTHSFFVDGTDKSSDCKPSGGILGGSLTSDGSGVLDFIYYYYPTVEVTNIVTRGAATTEKRASTKAIRVTDTSGQSTANSTIEVHDYIKRIVNEGITPPRENTAIGRPAAGRIPRGGGVDSSGLDRRKLV